MKALAGLMKQAQQAQEKLQQAQEDVAQLRVEGKSGAGLVVVQMTGRYELATVHIDDALMGDDKAVLEDLIAAAVNDAAQRVQRQASERMAEVTAGMSLPPGFKMPF